MLLAGKAYHKCALFVVFVAYLVGNNVLAKPLYAEDSDPADFLIPFTTDGCSLFPNGPIWHDDLWLDCCVAHDLAYWRGGSYQDRLDADEDLLACVDQRGEPAVAITMLVGVRAGGSPFWMTPFRWGFGWKSWRGYRVLSADELALLDAMLERQKLKK